MKIDIGASAKINFTMPVFNRFSATQKALLGLYKTDKSIPYSITVVDNGSESALVKRLLEFYRNKRGSKGNGNKYESSRSLWPHRYWRIGFWRNIPIRRMSSTW